MVRVRENHGGDDGEENIEEIEEVVENKTEDEVMSEEESLEAEE